MAQQFLKKKLEIKIRQTYKYKRENNLSCRDIVAARTLEH